MGDEKISVLVSSSNIGELKEYISPEELYQYLIERVQKYHPSDDISLIEKAYHIANEAHKEQFRKSGEPYIIHPLSVAIILAELELDKETIIAGILHDVVEDTIMTEKEIANIFGDDVALLVDGVTKLEQIPLTTKIMNNAGEEKLQMQAENLRKMFLAMAKDIRVIMIKLADRLHNMRTLEHMPPEKQQRISRETLEIYAPIAQRLGISKIKVQLDDLSLKYLEPEIYEDLVEKIQLRKNTREKYILSIVEEVSDYIKHTGIEAKIDGRVKHLFSIYKKMKNQDKTLDQIYDLFAVRIIVQSVKDCYAVLGVIHEMYKPLPGRFKDYIAVPKANKYQSLHSTLIGQNGHLFEIQIRTLDMHKAAEYGIAAHWKYKDASDGKKVEAQEEEKLAWLREVLEWQKELSDNYEFMNALKNNFDLFSDKVYCFTPEGEIKNLPAGSTPIDFAYSVHSAVGNRMVGARVNGKLVTIDYAIKNGDRIEIITSQNTKGPSRDWLNVVKSSQAKNKINQWFKHEFKEENILKGKEMISIYCKAKNIVQSNILQTKYMELIMKKFGFSDWDALLAAIGHGGLKEGQVINKMSEFYEKDHKKEKSNEEVLEEIKLQAAVTKIPKGKSKNGITVKGADDVAVRYSKCCAPVPGDDIIGFITRGRGISIHRTDCVNIINLPEIERERFIDADWLEEVEMDGKAIYLADLKIYATNRNGLLADISKTLTEKDISIQSINTRTNKQGLVTMQTIIEVKGKEELNRVIEKIRNIENILDVERTTG